jgi:hypothetical protein
MSFVITIVSNVKFIYNKYNFFLKIDIIIFIHVSNFPSGQIILVFWPFQTLWDCFYPWILVICKRKQT